ncbi:MAG TPA: hypothetical protein VEL31_06040, partial [Ktedonobacteraceae bacterium]|nr:hypothetical protein [Ktedonobacteraceae bacterium]
ARFRPRVCEIGLLVACHGTDVESAQNFRHRSPLFLEQRETAANVVMQGALCQIVLVERRGRCVQDALCLARECILSVNQ